MTVVAGYAWAAEILAKAVLLRGAPHHFDVLANTGAEALVVDDHGCVDATPGMLSFVAGSQLPAVVDGVSALEEATR